MKERQFGIQSFLSYGYFYHDKTSLQLYSMKSNLDFRTVEQGGLMSMTSVFQTWATKQLQTIANFNSWPVNFDSWPVNFDSCPVNFNSWPVNFNSWPVNFD